MVKHLKVGSQGTAHNESRIDAWEARWIEEKWFTTTYTLNYNHNISWSLKSFQQTTSALHQIFSTDKIFFILIFC